MSEIGAYTIARWIADEIQNSSYLSLRSIIEEVLKTHTPWSDEQIFETSEKLEEKIFKELEKITNILIEDGIEPNFHLDGEPLTAYIKSTDLRVFPVLEKLRKISPSEFEQFCGDILTSLGGISRISGKTGDGGIDFIATDIPLTHHNLPALNKVKPIVIGQAKRYKEKNFVSVNEVRDFLGGALFIQETIRREKHGVFTPVIFAYWTTSDFSKDAFEFCRQAGLWGLNGVSLAQLSIRLKVNVDL